MEAGQLVCGANELAGFCVVYGFCLDVSLYELFSLLITNSHVSVNLTALLPYRPCRHRSVGKQGGLTDWFLYGPPYSIEGCLKNLSHSFINKLCAKTCNSSNTLNFFHIPPNNVSEIL